MIAIQDATFVIADQQRFQIAQLQITAGSSWVFVGSNGSGKTTLAKVLAGELAPIRGSVTNQFSRVVRISFEQLQQLIAAEWQRSNNDLLDEAESGRTTAEIIQAEIRDPARCQQLAAQFGIGHLLSRHFKLLSTGETRKVMLCQALMPQADLLILDEPFEGLDVASREQLSQQLQQFTAQGVTLVLIVNRFNQIAQWIQHVGLLQQCALQQTGTAEQILQQQVLQQLQQLEQRQDQPLPAAAAEHQTLDPTIARVILKQGTVRYQDQLILNQLDWQVNAGEHWLIVGPNGAGKSTLLSMITGDHPQGYSNDLTLFGRRRGSGETLWQIKQHIGYVSSSLHQDYRVSISVKNVLLSGFFDSIGLYQRASDQQLQLAQQWLSLLGLQQQADQPFQALSWGQQRVVLIARAMLKYPTLLILDEPFQGLDELNRQLVKYWIERLLQQGKTQLILVSHHLEDAPAGMTHCLLFIPDATKGYTYQCKLLK